MEETMTQLTRTDMLSDLSELGINGLSALADGGVATIHAKYFPEQHVQPDEKDYDYICSNCGEKYKYGWSDEEARAEKERDFSDVPFDKCVVVCDDCYKKIMGISTEQVDEAFKEIEVKP
jgi:hypothetical protein